MADPLVVVSDTKTIISQGIVIIDYDTAPYHALCRYGLWEGWQKLYTETVTLAYEHTVEEYVGWQVNGLTIMAPGFSAGTPPWGAPLPGFPSVTYVCPVDGYYHEISFTSSVNDPVEEFWVQVLYRTSEEQQTPTYGPGMWVTLSGQCIEWPWFLLAEMRACIQRLLEIINSIRATLGELEPVNPPDPVEWAARFTPDEVRRVKAGVEIFQKLDEEKQPELANRIAVDVSGIVQMRTPDAKGFYGFGKGANKPG
jgi:hypothetical protein